MPDTSLTLGPFLLGGCFNFMLYGVCVVQTFLYFQTYSRDPPRIRLLVVYLFVMETINSGCTIGLLYEPLVLHYGDQVSFEKRPVMLIADALVTVLISTPAQIFVAWRLKIVSRSSFIPIIIILLAIVSLVGGIKITASVIMTQDYGHFSSFTPTVIVWLASSAAADLLITSGLTWSLRTRNFVGMKETEDKVTRIMRLTIQTGFITMAFAIIDLAVYVARPNTTLNFIFDFALSKLYTNSLLSTLNARSGWDHLGQAQEVNVLFDRSELSAMQKHQMGVEGGHGVGHVESAFTTRSNANQRTVENIELQTTVTVLPDSVYTRGSHETIGKTVGLV
ncbi:hypothetical protein D9619_004755 [Psilocybe cf. subviscida]|uniref:DUF6534 domain-containing protein n=1 Tax=Psilocybe cf. subviscida TaxID=2480587 RepID=A0A8H5BQQ6_9AGAR|nr:hypothetical protein D9619_004755 [Psilocybe cf. subviscida]